MRRVYAVGIGLAMLLAAVLATPGVAVADTYAGTTARQQAIKQVIARALAQRGVPYTYGGGNASGPTASAVPAPISADAATIPAPGGVQLANVPVVPTPVPGLPTPIAAPTATPGVVGFDASGLVQYAFAGVGIKLPRSSGEQYKVGRKISPAEALPGDLIFYGPEGSQSVALFVGNGQMVEATNPTVTVSAVRTATMAPYLSRIIEW